MRGLLCCALLLPACRSDGDAADSQPPGPADEAAVSEGSAAPMEATEIVADDDATAAVWIGVYCQTVESQRTLSFYVDGSEVQRIDCRCEGEISKDVAPNCGQFYVDVQTGVRLFRVQDDTGDAHAEQELGVTSDRWVTIAHREVGPGSGFLTSFDEWQVRPRHALSRE